MDYGAKLQDVEGYYAKFDDDKLYTVSWTQSRGNWAEGSIANIEYLANVNTAGFWSIDRARTRLLAGQEPDDKTEIFMTLQKEGLGLVTTGIKAGGQISGVICYK